MKKPRPDAGEKNGSPNALVSAAKAQKLDAEAAGMGLDRHSLVEAAGRLCARQFCKIFLQGGKASSHNRDSPLLCVLAGSGNNAADALVMLKTLVVMRNTDAASCSVLLAKLPDAGAQSPLSNAFIAVQRLGIAVNAWEAASLKYLQNAEIVIDGIAGTGINGPLYGTAAEMTEAVNSLKKQRPGIVVVSIDVPSGNFDKWQPSMSIVHADASLAIEPEKLCLYSPASRTAAGRIIKVQGIFPPELITQYMEAVLLDWNYCSSLIAPVKPDAHKYQRGLTEIWAGSTGYAGAAMLAARGAQASGAGLVRLIADDSIYPVLAAGSGGIMVAPQGQALLNPNTDTGGRFRPDAILAGPGWGRGPDRAKLLEKFLPLEAQGVPLILDADAIALAKGLVFNGNALITPHPGEFAEYTGLSTKEILSDPIPILRDYAAKNKVNILLKGHVLYIACPQSAQPLPNSPLSVPNIGVLDGMNPALAAGGSGDVLAGICAGIAGRMAAGSSAETLKFSSGDFFPCAAAAASLFLEAARSIKSRFFDPLELAYAVAGIAGKAWLSSGVL